MSYDPFGRSAEDLPEPHRNEQEPAPPDARRGSFGPPASDEGPDAYADVPASLELSYTQSDLGLGPAAYEDAYPYGRAPRARRSSGIRMRRVTRELAETVILALLIFFAVKAVVQNFRVEGASMEPSLETRQYLLVNKAIYFRVNMDRIHRFLPFVPEDGDGVRRHLFRAPRRGDVIVFHFPCEKNREFIKRVIGVPGDTVEIHDSQVFINGGPLVEDFTSGPPNYTYGPRTVPAGQYFVLGDNRVNSFDSHTWGASCTARPEAERDFVPEQNIIGQAWISYWPWADLGFINNKTLKPQAE